MDDTTWMHRVSALRLIDRCKEEFGWKDLSSDVIMDVGCGVNGFGGKTILEMFPDAGTIIGIDRNPEEANNLRKGIEKIEYAVADIEKRESLRKYEGRMSKVISIHVFHQIKEKEVAFRNIYHLLKLGGEAAVLFTTKSLIYEWLTEMLKKPQWKNAYQCYYVEDLYKSVLDLEKYKEMVMKIGFKAAKCFKENREFEFPSDKDCKEALYQIWGKSFNVSPELLEEFKEESFQVFLKISARNEEGKPCCRFTEVSLLFTKPTEDSGSKTEDNIVPE